MLKRAEELGRDNDDNSNRLMAGFLYASKAERDKIDPKDLERAPRG